MASRPTGSEDFIGIENFHVLMFSSEKTDSMAATLVYAAIISWLEDNKDRPRVYSISADM